MDNYTRPTFDDYREALLATVDSIVERDFGGLYVTERVTMSSMIRDYVSQHPLYLRYLLRGVNPLFHIANEEVQILLNLLQTLSNEALRLNMW